MGAIEKFNQEKIVRINEYEHNKQLIELSQKWLELSMKNKYVYNFSWLGRPIIQNPIDLIVMQEIVYDLKPDLIIETGIAHGGSLIFYASLLELNTICGGPKDAKIIGIDVDIREHNRKQIESHPLYKRIKMFQGSSVDLEIAKKVKFETKDKQCILVCLDSNHTHDHVFNELNIYAPLVSIGSYCVVFDTFIESMPKDVFPDRPWSRGNNPQTAVQEYLKTHPEFEIDKMIENKLLITTIPNGFLKRKK